MAKDLDISQLSDFQKEVLFQMAIDFKYDDYSEEGSHIDYKMFEDVDPHQIALYFAEKLEEIKNEQC